MGDGAEPVGPCAFDDDDYATRRGWGHSPVSRAIEVAERAGAKRLSLFHHNPDSTDDVIDALQAKAQKMTSIPVSAASESDAIEL